MSGSLAFRRSTTFLLAVASMLAISDSAMAQSTTRTAPSAVPQGASSRMAASPVALQGYCPVCVVKMKKWMRGNPAIQAAYDGKVYYFPGEEQRQMFLASPEKFVPALGGDCSVCLTDMGKRMPGSIYHSALNHNRLYLFPSAEQKQKFVADPKKYNRADLALSGNCVVCRVEMKQDVPGSPEVYLTHGGMRYQFASGDQRKMFLANPSKYAKALPAGGSTTK